jgi:hypothetical protein
MRLLLLQVLAETQGNTSAVPFDQIDKVSTAALVLVASDGQAAGAAEHAVLEGSCQASSAARLAWQNRYVHCNRYTELARQHAQA